MNGSNVHNGWTELAHHAGNNPQNGSMNGSNVHNGWS
jgi:hypothetical protein